GHDINVHDQWAVESQGAIQDRTREHLGVTDKGIVAYRRMLVQAIEGLHAGEAPLMVLAPDQAATLRGPVSIDGVSASSLARRKSTGVRRIAHVVMPVRGPPAFLFFDFAARNRRESLRRKTRFAVRRT